MGYGEVESLSREETREWEEGEDWWEESRDVCLEWEERECE